MYQQLGKFILKLLGWKLTGGVPEGVQKAVVISAPHTSNWDFVIGFLTYMALGVKSRYLIKREAFFFPLGPILKALGAIPVDRNHSSNVVQQVGELFKTSNNMLVTITPEGTRKLVKHWKRGFYYIAEHAKVPILVGIVDYGKKEIGIAYKFDTTGNYEKDLAEIESYYKGKTAKHPENFNLSAESLKNKK